MRTPSRSHVRRRVTMGGAVALTAGLLVALTAGLLLAPAATAGSPVESPVASAAGMPAGLDIEADVVSGTLDATGATWTMRIPRLTGPLDPVVLETIDATLATGVADDLSAFEAGSSPPIDEAMSPDSLAIDFTVALLTRDVASIRMLASTYWSGAAHPGSALETWTFDLRTGQRLALADLFSPGVDALGIIATEARRALLDGYATDRSSRQWVKDGTQPSEANFGGWALTPDGLEITFGQYQVAPYAEGMPVVVIGWPKLAGLLDPDGPAAEFLDGAGLVVPLPTALPSPSAP